MEQIETEKLILSSLCLNEDFSRQCLIYLKEEYFSGIELDVFKMISSYAKQYNALPNKTILLHNTNSFENEQKQQECRNLINTLFKIERPTNYEWLIEETENYCRNKAVYNAIVTSLSIYDGTEKKLQPHAIPELLADAIAVSFDNSIGMDLYDDVERRYELYTEEKHKIPFTLPMLNLVTNGGITRKTLNIIGAPINGGKSLFLVDLAVSYVKQGFNVLYVSLEMSESEIFKRIDGNLFDVSVNELDKISLEKFKSKLEVIKRKNYGKLKVKEFPSGIGSPAHIKATLNELKLKHKFIPDILIVDYLGICASSIIKAGSTNSYHYLKSVSEELRAIGQVYDCAIWTAAQFQRNSQQASDVNMDDIAESLAIAATADFMLGLIRSEELDNLGQVLIKQMKNRYGDRSKQPRFVLGVDLEKQQVYSVNDSEQEDIVNERELKVQDTALSNKMKNKFAALQENSN